MKLTTEGRIAARLAILLLVLAAPAARAQTPAAVVPSTARTATRESLEAAAQDFDRLAASPAYREELRARARAEAAGVRRRLSEGDFRVGDRILLRVEGQVMLDDTVTVQEGQRIVVRGIRQVALAGVLRSELETTLRAELGEVVRNTTVSASPLMRIAVLGSVTRPGYLSVTDATTLDRLITLAGGPVAAAGISKTTVTRADTVVLNETEVQRALASGTTIAQLGLLDGDALDVPDRPGRWDAPQRIQLITSILIPIITILFVRR